MLHLSNQGKRVLSARGVASCIPFVFESRVRDLVGGREQRTCSCSATIACGATTPRSTAPSSAGSSSAARRTLRAGARGRLYLWTCYLALPLFLLVAFGIDGIPYLKRVGAVGLSIVVPLVVGRYALDVRGRARTSFLLAMTEASPSSSSR